MEVDASPMRATYFGNTGFTHDEVLVAGHELAVDALRLKPRNVASLNREQLDVVSHAVEIAMSSGVDSGNVILSNLGATWLLEKAREQ